MPPDPALAAEALGRPGRVTWVLTGSPARGWLPREQERARGDAGQDSSAFLRKPGPCACLQGPCPPPGLPRSSPGSRGPACATLLAARGAGLTSHLPRRPVSCSRDQMLWMRPACSGWLLVFPQVHWCFSISVSYTRPGAEAEAPPSHEPAGSWAAAPAGSPLTALAPWSASPPPRGGGS